jgi:hypothetical protein
MEHFLDVDMSSGYGKVETGALATSVSNTQCLNVGTSVISDDQAKSDVEIEFLCELSHRKKPSLSHQLLLGMRSLKM